ncbi:Glycosyl transferase, group 1 family protein [Flavobacterium branchiophilum]|uniref:Glycosyl transferase, group 1 family protein n=1 Tax=Flavobacterium branchiophilum (strain FL-15) TaxID=1034807 RepID=G2Z6Z6_FLABF|nr:glycosyltransferase [Flavobacterium branchiophilum]CCB68998.1 Glycosyl transferase, group 1 family protein [Flavobacterium branchiophilum FL-15]
MNVPNTKIALVSHSYSKGGAERFAASLSFLLDEAGFDIYNILICNEVDFAYKGTLLNLGKINGFPVVKKIKKAYILYKYLKQEKIDVIIDNRTHNQFFSDWILYRIFSNRKKICIVHSSFIQNYIPENIFLAKFLFTKNTKFIGVSKYITNSIKEKYPFFKSFLIYNFINTEHLERQKILNKSNYILYFGRIDNKVKNFDLMLESYKLSEVFKQGIKLYIMGDGNDDELLRNLIFKFKLDEYVVRIPFNNNPFEYVSKALFTLLTSHYEGFPLSIIESLSLATPVVSVDCISGPSEIVVNRKNGILVPNYQPKLLSKAIQEMVLNEELYLVCKENALKSVFHLSKQPIAKQWKKIIES